MLPAILFQGVICMMKNGLLSFRRIDATVGHPPLIATGCNGGTSLAFCFFIVKCEV